MRALLFLCLLGGAALSARAQSNPPPTKILFVGNSFTYGGSTTVHGYNAATVTDEPPGEPGVGGIPAIFKKFADEAGLRYEVHVETVGGKDLEFHYQHARDLVAQNQWDAVVLQGYSTEPLPVACGGEPENFLHFAALLENTIHRARPTTKIYLYETWAYPFKTYSEDSSDPLAWRRAMSKDLQAGYARAFSTAGRFEAIAPVGDAYLKAAGAKPAINLLDTDHKHPSVEGSYLSALVLFETTTRSDVMKLGAGEQAAHDLGIPPGTAVDLQTVAAGVTRSGLINGW